MDSSTLQDRPSPARNGDLVNRVAKLRLDNQPNGAPERSGAIWLPWTLCVLLALAWAGGAIRWYRTPSATTEAPASRPTDSGKAATPAAPSAAPGSILLEVKGYFTPARQIAVSPIDVAGRVIELNVVEGKKYNKDDVLARIEDTSYKAQEQEAKAAVASAEKRLDLAKAKFAALMPASVRPIEITQVQEELKEAESQRARAHDEVERLNRLGIGTAAERELNQAKFDLLGAAARVLRLTATLTILKEGPRQEMKDAANAEVRSAEADIAAAKARLTQATWRLGNCIIRAPIAGTVLTKKAELYNLVNPLAFAATSGSVCDLADLADLEVDLEVAERDIHKLAKVGKVRVRSDAWTDRSYEGTLDRVMPIANRSNGVIKVRVKVKLPEGEEPGSYLKPEMGGTVTFLVN